MGKVRIKTFDESAEDEAKLKARKEAKKAEKMAKKAVKKEEGEKAPESNEIISADTIEKTGESLQPEAKTEEKKEVKTEKKSKKEKFLKVKVESSRHKGNKTLVSKTQKYTLDQALDALRKFKKSNFDETVELHINLKEKGVSGKVTLPHGTGKTLKIKIADENIISDIEKGKIDFDILVAAPNMMPNLAKVARILGPKGLMPNPKNGTVSPNPEDAVKKLSGGQISYKTEPVAPIIHIGIGKLSFEDKQLNENVKVMLDSIKGTNIKSVVLKSTMSPAIPLDYSFVK